MTYKEIYGATPEFTAILQRMDDLNQPFPNLLLPSVGFTAFDAGKICGCGLLQCVPLIEPFTVDREYSGGMVAPHLFRMAEQYIRQNGIPRVLMHSDDPRMQKMILRAGGRPTNQTWFEFRSEWMPDGDK